MYDVEREAIKFRVENKITTLPIDYEFMLLLLRDKGYILKTYIQAHNELVENKLIENTYVYNGFTVISGSSVEIYLKDTLSLNQKVFVLAHELGHIVLRHSYHGILGMSDDEKTATKLEDEANDFALSFLAPICILSTLNVVSFPDITKLTLLNEDLVTKVLNKIKTLTLSPNEYEKRLISLYVHTNNKSLKNIKHLYIIIALFLFLAATILVSINIINNKNLLIEQHKNALIEQNQREELQQIQENFIDNVTVYASPSGTKYHIKDCTYIQNKESIEMTLKEAETKQYSECSQCEPKQQMINELY